MHTFISIFQKSIKRALNLRYWYFRKPNSLYSFWGAAPSRPPDSEIHYWNQPPPSENLRSVPNWYISYRFRFHILSTSIVGAYFTMSFRRSANQQCVHHSYTTFFGSHICEFCYIVCHQVHQCNALSVFQKYKYVAIATVKQKMVHIKHKRLCLFSNMVCYIFFPQSNMQYVQFSMLTYCVQVVKIMLLRLL